MGVYYIPVAEPGEVQPGDMKPIDLGGREAILANVDGELFAFGRECPHEASDLVTAEITADKRIRCEGHSYVFDLCSGECVMPPGGPALAVLPVEEHDGKVCVRLEW